MNKMRDEAQVAQTLLTKNCGGSSEVPAISYGFKPMQGAKAEGMGFQKEVSPTLNATNSCGGGVLVVSSEPIVFRDDITIKIDGGGTAFTVGARDFKGAQCVMQKVTGTLSPGGHPGSYNGQDAYNDLLVVDDGSSMYGKRTVGSDNNEADSKYTGLYARSASNPELQDGRLRRGGVKSHRH